MAKGLILSPRGTDTGSPAGVPSMINPYLLQKLAEALKKPATPGVVPPTPPTIAQNAMPAFEPSTLDTGGGTTPGGVIGGTIGTGLGQGVRMPSAAPPMAPPMQTAVSPPPTVSPGDQPGALPPVTDMGFVNGGPNTPGFWKRINDALQAQQIPDGYRGAMGEMIKNG